MNKYIKNILLKVKYSSRTPKKWPRAVDRGKALSPNSILKQLFTNRFCCAKAEKI